VAPSRNLEERSGKKGGRKKRISEIIFQPASPEAKSVAFTPITRMRGEIFLGGRRLGEKKGKKTARDKKGNFEGFPSGSPYSSSKKLYFTQRLISRVRSRTHGGLIAGSYLQS